MNTKPHICYRCVGGLGPASACSLVGRLSVASKKCNTQGSCFISVIQKVIVTVFVLGKKISLFKVLI